MAEGNNLHSLRQVTPYPRRIDHGLAQHGTPGLQNGKLLNPFLALPLRLLLLLLDVG
jgi:hypothetical protein